ncbi:MAG: right-handed parallel beta-helix repeat-containing protein [Sandaracinaceae bacterium]
MHDGRWRRAWLFLLALGLAGCSCDGEDNPDGSMMMPDGGPGTSPDAAMSDASTLTPIPAEGECAWEVGERPTADLPPVHDNEYTLELERWMIDNDGGDPVETRQRMNEGIAWAVDNGFNKVIVPSGRYLVGELTNDIYSAGIQLPGDMTLELADDAVIEMAPNDRHNYCVISVDGNENITIRGGQIRGDRADHMYVGDTAHDEGHGVCVWTSANRVLIEDTELTELTGDGVLIVGSRGTDEEPEVPSTHVTIRNNEIHHNRRNGVAVVGGHNVVIENNHIHHIQGTAPQFGVDVEGAGRTDRDILIFRNNFHDNWGGDFVTSTGRNVWLEENTMTQCQVNDAGEFDASLPCETDPDEDRWAGQSDGPIVLWQNTDTVVLNNRVRMTSRSSNGLWGLIGYPNEREAVRNNDVGNFIAGNTFFDCGVHDSWNRLQYISNNTVHNSLMLLFRLECTRLEDNHVNRESGLRYQIRNVAGLAEGNSFNREAETGFPEGDDIEAHFPMSDDAPYRNSSPVFW